MSHLRACLIVLLVFASLGAAGQGTRAAPLRVVTTTLPPPVVGGYYDVPLQATGGQPPYRWAVTQGTLPLGIHLDATSGLLVGTPTRTGPYHFTVQVTDSATAPQHAMQEFSSEAQPSLSIRWIHPPQVQDGGIFGSVQVANNLARRIDLTLIIVGVNEIGKSFVLGYQHAMIPAKTILPEIPFGFTLPRGSYVVHADVVGEDPRTEALFRTRTQTASALAVP